jgi:hypothetical protein
MRPPKDELEDACARWGWDGAAEEYGVDRATIVRWLRESDMHGESTRGRKPKAPKPKRKRKRIDHEEVLRLYAEHKSSPVVANMMGCNATTVRRILERHGVKRKANAMDVSPWTPWMRAGHLARLLGVPTPTLVVAARFGHMVRGEIEVDSRPAEGPGSTKSEYRARVDP